MVGAAHPMRGGIAQYNALLARELSKRHEVDLVSFTRQYPAFLFPGKTQMDTTKSPFSYPATALVDTVAPWTWERAAKHLAEFRPDGLVFKYWMPFFAPAFGWIARSLQRRMRAAHSPSLPHAPNPRVVLVLDNLIPHEHRPFDASLTRWMTSVTDAYIVQSASVREDLLRLVPRARFLEVPHPVYPIFGDPRPKADARRILGLDPNEPIVLFFGFVRRYKGLDLLIEALALARRELPIRLYVLGEFYEDRAPIEARIRALDLGDAVVVRDDYVPDEQVGLWFSACDAVVLPYRSATQSGIVPIAWHLERPVLCTAVGGLPEIVRDGELGLTVPPEDPAALAAAMIRYYRENLESRFTPAIRAEKERYSWARMADAVETLVRGEPEE